MAISGRLLVLMVGALVAFVPVAEARTCKPGKDAKAAVRCKDKATGRSAASVRKPAGKKPKARVARLEFVDGLAKGAPKPIPVRGTDRHGESFRSRVLDPESKKAQATNAAPAGALPPPTIAETPSRKPEAAAATPNPAAVAVAPSAPQAPPPSAIAAAPATATVPTARPAVEKAVKLNPAMPAAMEGQAFRFGTGCYMDTLDGQLWEGAVLTVRDRKSLRIQGWAVDDEGKKLPEASYLRFENSDGRRFYAPTIPEDRPDVARHFGVPAFARAGYRAVVSAENLPAGEYEVMILMNAGGRNMLCGNGRRLKLGL